MTRPRTALVLSAGGMFGAYQAGVWKVLEKHLQPDLVVGASVGALNGWLIAAGYGGSDLAQRWLDPAAGDALQLLPQAGWRKGWFDPASLRATAEKLFSEAQPRLPFGLVVLRWPRLRTVLVQYPDITADHLQATCSIPFVLPPVEIHAKRYVDGGFLEKLPLRAAIEMGADKIIAIDSLPQIDLWWLRRAMQVAHALRPRRALPGVVSVTTIAPSQPLGNFRDAVFWKRDNAERWIALGERDAEHHARERQIA